MEEKKTVRTAPPDRDKSYRVLHVLDHSLPVLSGYAVRSRNLIEAQKNIGFSPEALTGPLHELDDADSSETQIDGIRYRRTPVGDLARRLLDRRGLPVREATVVCLYRNRISAILASGQFDFVHAHSPALCGLAAWDAARRHKVPFIYEIRAFWEDAAVDQNKTQTLSLRYRLGRELEGFVAGRADAVVGIATHILKDLSGRGIDRGKLFHVSNGVNTGRFLPMQRDEELTNKLGIDDRPVFGFFGSLYRYEGIPWLVKAAAELQKRGYRFRVLLAGSGEDRQAVLDAIHQYDVTSCVQFLGHIPHEEIKRYYSLVDVLVYPRLSNRLTELVTPLKPLEAMSQAKAVLGSSVGGIRELVDDENTGLIFQAEDVGHFCHQAARLLESSAFRRVLAERGRQFVLQHKDWNVLAHRYADVYEYASRRHSRA